MASGTLTLSPRLSSPAPAKTILKIVLGLLVFAPVVVAVRAGAYDSFVDNALTGFGFWGTFTIHMWTRPRRKEWGVTVVLGLALRLLYDVIIGEHGYPGYLVIGMGTFLGISSLLVMSAQAVRAPGDRRDACRRSLRYIVLMTYLGFCLGFYLPFAKLMLPRKFDYHLYYFDAALGFQASFLAGKLLHRFPALFWLEWTVYNCFGIWFSITYAAHANSRVRFPVNVIKMMVANALIGFALYFACPAAGPKYAFPSFPHLPASVPFSMVPLNATPNAMPSLHFGGALLLCWFCRPWKWLYRAMIVFASLTALATLGLGEHYLVDLVVAVPYALAMLAFACDVPERKTPLVAGTAMLALWLVLLRVTQFPTAIAWTMVAGTLAVSFTLQRRLASRLWAR